ncbi:MAG: ABC transporter ATP-binding protein/permease [Defluviitaleaceae bacterium]|nr:ABC transporter ATP-binding protein/permease [Defluviitaleaceae bacterium]
MEKTNPQFFRQNIYAVKMLWRLSKSRVIHTAVNSAVGYFEWLFGSLFFVRYIVHALETQAEFSTLLWFIGITALVLGATSLYSGYVDMSVNPITGNVIRRGLYAKLYAKARNVELRCYEDADFYDKYTMALDNADGRIVQTAGTFFSIVTGLVASGVAFYVMFTIDPFSVLFVILPIVGNFFFGSIMSKLEGRQYAENTPHNRKSGYVTRVMYLAEFAKEVRMSNIFRLMMRRFDDAVSSNRAVADKFAVKGTLSLWIKNITTFSLVFEGIMIYAAYRAIVSQTIGLAELAILLSAMVTTSWIFIGLFGDISESLKNCVFIKYLRGFMEYKEEIPEDQDGLMPSSQVDSIEFKNVTFTYKDGHTAINDCSFVINGGETVAFAGHNGAGKSTLIKLLFRLYDPTSGEVLVNGINIKKYNLKAYRRLFAAAFQDYKIFSMSVEENVLLNETNATHEENRAETALKQAGVWNEISALRNGINTTLTKEFDENGAVLSEGNIQKVVVARAFANPAPVQVYDEPSSALDPIAEYNLYTGIMAASRGHTTLFISHRLSSVADADIVYVLEHGAIIEKGSHSALMAANGKYAEMFTMQAQSYLADEEVVVA